MNIPLIDLKAQYNSIKREIDPAIQDVLDTTQFILGPRIEKFEREYSKYCGTKFCVGVSSGTSAVHLALATSCIKPGDEVITVPNTFIATTECISLVGANIKFVDIDKETCNIDFEKIEKAITPKTKAILPVHLYGQIADMKPIIEIAEKHSLAVIEDSAQAHGAEYDGKKAPIVNVAAYSFFPAKILGAYGDAGAVVTNDKEVYEKIKLLRFHGTRDKKTFFMEGYNHRLDELQAAILNVKLKYLDKWVSQRREHAKLYNELLDGVVELPYEMKGAKHSYYLYVIRTKKRDQLQEYLKKNGIGTGIHYYPPLHLQPAYRHLGYKEGSFPATEQVSKEILSLPMYPELAEEQINYVAEKVKEFLK